MMPLNRHVIVSVFFCLLLLQGCDKVEEAAEKIEEVKESVLEISTMGEGDAYKPIRKGHIELNKIPNGAEVMTWKKYYQQRYEWHKQTYVANYKKYGHRSPKWDQAVIELLEQYAIFRREHTDNTFRRKLLDKANHILAMGCQDGRIISIKGILLFNIENSVDAAPLLTKGFELLKQSQYPKRYAFFSAGHLCQVYGNSRGAANPWEKYNHEMLKYLGQAAGDIDYTNGNERYYIEDFIAIFKGDQCRLPENAQICIQQIESLKEVDPWIKQTAKGIYHIAYGWKYRGTGYASSVSEEGWHKFKAELDIARKCLTRAYELHPQYPEPAASMIVIAMTTTDQDGQQLWFDRAVKAHFDYLPAYKHMFWALRPRWGGSRLKMMKLGVECLNTARFDTRVPSRFLVSLFDIGDEMNNWRAPYQWEGIYDLIQQYFEGLLNEPQNKDYYDENKSFYVVVAWAAGQFEDAGRMKGELGDRFDSKAYGYLNVTEQQVLNDLK